ncbi:hypothetical protein P3X46_032321 [Hevea brasiliensis]|uniref:Survival Motor Neuron Gemin2-binding domain-containing protein n=1 Tax=Hevea brasiliensis TaxID=3981 RepID=A0ABQ9KD30_HEVBR|nr:uncharacterized protein LOC110661581 isoform X1 [Hevea brasiliensis]KAJ9135102.1 hypothetical protein P3X46_032321 [Hevea brasiliensis]
MGTEGDLWDDSALINAFEDAMSKYKKMHGKKIKENLIDEGNGGSAFAAEIHGAVSDADENGNVTSNAAEELGETKNLTPVRENHCLSSVEPEPCIDSSSGQHKQAVNEYSYSQNWEGYQLLCQQYYDLEEKRQGILRQLQQLGGYGYQCPAECYDSSQQWGTCCTYDDLSFPTTQPSFSTVACSCCPYACHGSAAPCMSFPTCSFCGTCAEKMFANSSGATVPAKHSPHEDGDIVKTAMEAAERAISSMKTLSSINSGTEEKGKGKDGEEISQSTCSGTDLSVVLNAWYSAGFYTGKYLTEQSIMKKQH